MIVTHCFCCGKNACRCLIGFQSLPCSDDLIRLRCLSSRRSCNLSHPEPYPSGEPPPTAATPLHQPMLRCLDVRGNLRTLQASAGPPPGRLG